MVKTANVDHKTYIKAELTEASEVLRNTINKTEEIEDLAKILIQAFEKGKKLVLFGNGGSAADAQHLATELLGGFTNHNRNSLPALALTTDTSALTAIGNDYDFDTVFARQAEALVNPGDVVLALSTSGNSKNVIKGVQSCKRRGATVIGLTGESGGELKNQCDHVFCVPSKKTAHIQQAHMTVGHILCALVEKALSDSS